MATQQESLQQVLKDNTLGVDARDIAVALRHLEHQGVAYRIRPGSRARRLPPRARAALDAFSGVTPEETTRARKIQGQWLAEQAIEDAVAGKGALTTNQVAALLGINASRVRHRKAAGALYAIDPPTGGRRSAVYPRWQFTSTDAGREEPLPHLKAVLAALPRGMHPLEVEQFFVTENDALIFRDEPVSPCAWLASGGDPEPVRWAAESLHVLG
jgi:hypothetical protein